MPSLSDYAERFSNLAKYIHSTAAATSLFSEHHEDGKLVPGGPFTRAVLYTPLGDLIRDIDPSELGLFTLTTHSQAASGQGSSRIPKRDAKGLPKEAVSRVEFAGATPLRKPVRRDEIQKVKEPEPEVYAQAALKYLDRFQSVRPMPRARSQVVAIIDELAALRENIQTLNETLKQSTSLGDAPSSPKSLANAEERRIQEVQAKIQQLKIRKDELSKKSRPRIGRTLRPRHHPSSEKTDARSPIASSSKADPQEEMFWNTPGAHVRTLHFTDNLLMDEQVDLGDISTVSFSSPVPPRTEPRLSSRPQEDELEDKEQGYPEEPELPNEPLNETFNKDGPEERRLDDPGDNDEKGEEEGEEDTTIILKKPPASVPLTPPTPAPHDDQSHEEPSTPAVPKIETPSARIKKPKIKIVNDVERIVSKIWSTIGEIIMPGHPFDVTGSTASSKPPRAKETIAHLQHLSTQEPSPASPSASSSSSFSAAAPSSGHVTTQQILTAHLLLTLLWSSPNYTLPLNKLKEVLAEKAGTVGQSGTRVVYTCVAKRLLKIERGRGEQLVKFDI